MMKHSIDLTGVEAIKSPPGSNRARDACLLERVSGLFHLLSDHQRSITMQLGTTIPVLRIFNEKEAREFYLEFLGFSKDWEHRFGENFPLYMQVSRDRCILHLSGHHGDCCPGAAVRIDIAGVREFSEALRSKDYKHARPDCEATEWHTIEMSINDPFGNKLIFSERTDGAAT